MFDFTGYEAKPTFYYSSQDSCHFTLLKYGLMEASKGYGVSKPPGSYQ